MEERFKRFQQFLTGHTVGTKFHRKADAGPGGESLNVRLTVLMLSLRSLSFPGGITISLQCRIIVGSEEAR
jgi:hypothetical protein